MSISTDAIEGGIIGSASKQSHTFCRTGVLDWPEESRFSEVAFSEVDSVQEESSQVASEKPAPQQLRLTVQQSFGSLSFGVQHLLLQQLLIEKGREPSVDVIPAKLDTERTARLAKQQKPGREIGISSRIASRRPMIPY